jgi:hypothetical protein
VTSTVVKLQVLGFVESHLCDIDTKTDNGSGKKQPVIVENKDPYFTPRYIIIKHSPRPMLTITAARAKMPETQSKHESVPPVTPSVTGVSRTCDLTWAWSLSFFPAKPKGYHPVLESFDFPAKPKETRDPSYNAPQPGRSPQTLEGKLRDRAFRDGWTQLQRYLQPSVQPRRYRPRIILQEEWQEEPDQHKPLQESHSFRPKAPR